jgi:hypothetical protein
MPKEFVRFGEGVERFGEGFSDETDLVGADSRHEALIRSDRRIERPKC